MLSRPFQNVKAFILALPMFLGISNASAAAPSITIPNGTVVNGAVTLQVGFNSGDNPVSATQFDLVLPNNITFDTAVAGPAATNAGKGIASSLISGGARVVIFGFSTTPMVSGVLVTLTLKAANGTPANNYPIGITGVFSSDPNGDPVNTVSTGGMITVGGSTVQSFPLTGNVTLNGSALSGVSVNALTLGTQITSANGSYNFGNLPQGTNFVLTPSLSGYQFSPASFSGTVSSATNVNFAASQVSTPTFTLSGRVATVASGLAGVTVNAGNLGSRITDSNGSYSFTGVASGGTYTITPSLVGYLFNPTNRSLTISGNTTADFTASVVQAQTFTLSGTVTSSGVGLSDVLINGGGLGNRTTSSNGTFSFTGVPQGTQYVLTPSKTNFSFAPIQAIGTINSNLNLSFGATPTACTGTSCPGSTFSASGSVTFNNQGLGGVSVRLGRTYATTSANGSFSATGLTKGFYSARPVFPGMRFTPSSRRVELSSNVSDLTFTGVCFRSFQTVVNGRCDYLKHSVSGHVLINGAPVQGASIKIGRTRTTTDASGFYQIKDIGDGIYHPAIVKTRYIFTSPVGRNLTMTKDTTLDFTATCWRNYSVINGTCQRTPKN